MGPAQCINEILLMYLYTPNTYYYFESHVWSAVEVVLLIKLWYLSCRPSANLFNRAGIANHITYQIQNHISFLNTLHTSDSTSCVLCFSAGVLIITFNSSGATKKGFIWNFCFRNMPSIGDIRWWMGGLEPPPKYILDKTWKLFLSIRKTIVG